MSRANAWRLSGTLYPQAARKPLSASSASARPQRLAWPWVPAAPARKLAHCKRGFMFGESWVPPVMPSISPIALWIACPSAFAGSRSLRLTLNNPKVPRSVPSARCSLWGLTLLVLMKVLANLSIWLTFPCWEPPRCNCGGCFAVSQADLFSSPLSGFVPPHL